ncbi:hypothetical protein [Candidatus Nitrospira bockiana]
MTIRSLSLVSIIAAGLMLGACAGSDKGGMAGSNGSSMSATSGTNAAADPLQACLNSIPKDATAGQRSVAEQTCRRDFGQQDARPVASGTPGDTLEACMARIPKDATPGQRMVAEESCRRDEEARRRF